MRVAGADPASRATVDRDPDVVGLCLVCASATSGDGLPNTLVMSPLGPVPVFSSTTFASAVAPQSHPARVYGTHGAGAFFGVPLSPLTMTGVGSAGTADVSSTRSVQYLNDDDDAVVPSALK
jgi:hypothetical protein